MTRGFAKKSFPVTAGLTALLLATLLFSCRTPLTGPYLDAALEAGAWIESAGIRGPAGLSWPAVPSDPKTVALDLYGGVPGVVLFDVQAFLSTGEGSFLEDARGGADFLLSKAPSVESPGLYEGLSGIALALEETFKATRDEEYRSGFVDVLRRIASSAKAAGGGIEWSSTTDIISGGAGTGLFLVYAFHETGDRRWLDLAARAGTRLI